jgi:hypothetical protein
MKMNSDASIEIAHKVYLLFDGDWQKARDAATRSKDGVLIIRAPNSEHQLKLNLPRQTA